MSKKALEEIKNSLLPKRVSLFDIIHEYSNIASELENGEFDDEMEERLSINQEQLESKLLGYKYVIDQNDGKINSIYKPEIEKCNGKIKKLESINKRLKEQCCIAANVFGVDGKYKSETINVSAVETISLDIDDVEYNKSIEEISQCIINNNPEDITVETDFVKATLTIDSTPEILARILNYINNIEDSSITVSPKLNVTIDKRVALEKVKEINAYNEGLREQYRSVLETNNLFNKEEQSEIKQPEYRELAFKGLSLKSSQYPRFS